MKKSDPGCLGFIGDYTTQLYIGITKKILPSGKLT